MKIKFFAYIRDYTKCKEVEYRYCETVDTLLHRLCQTYGPGFAGRIFKGDELSGEIIILVNGRHITHLNGMKTKLNENDEISIFPVVAGG